VDLSALPARRSAPPLRLRLVGRPAGQAGLGGCFRGAEVTRQGPGAPGQRPACSGRPAGARGWAMGWPMLQMVDRMDQGLLPAQVVPNALLGRVGG